MKAKSGHPWLAERRREDHLVSHCLFEGKERPAERRKEDHVIRCQPSAKSGHPWLAERRQGDLVVKCHLKATSGHPWLAERQKADLFIKLYLKAKRPERRKENQVVKGLFEGIELPSLACGTSYRRPGRQVSAVRKGRPSLACGKTYSRPGR